MGGKLPQGLVDTTVAGTQKCLPFGSGDVITQATMMVGDKVQFNIATKQQTKEERAVNVEIQPETFQQESTEQRKIVSHLCLGALGIMAPSRCSKQESYFLANKFLWLPYLLNSP